MGLVGSNQDVHFMSASDPHHGQFALVDGKTTGKNPAASTFSFSKATLSPYIKLSGVDKKAKATLAFSDQNLPRLALSDRKGRERFIMGLDAGGVGVLDWRDETGQPRQRIGPGKETAQ